MEEGVWRDWSHGALSQEGKQGELNANAQLSSSFSFIPGPCPHGMTSHALEEGLPTLMDPIWKDLPQTQAEACLLSNSRSWQVRSRC